MTELNADLRERWTSVAAQSDLPLPAPPPRMMLNEHIRAYVRAANEHVNTASWLSRREVPTSAEILGRVDDTDEGDDELEIPVNVVQGPWDSKEDYLSAHYELLREDATAPLRDAVAEVREVPTMMDSQNICVYENVL